jgi:hypothetical protein
MGSPDERNTVLDAPISSASRKKTPMASLPSAFKACRFLLVDQAAFSDTSTSSSIFFASPNSMRLLSL